MTIGIVLHPYDEKKPAGLGGYILSLAKTLIENDLHNDYIIFVKKKPLRRPDISGDNWELHTLGFGFLWRELGFFFAPKVDVCIFNTPILPLFFRHSRSVVVALDFAYWSLGANTIKEKFLRYLLFFYNKISLWRADTIVAISGATKKDLLSIFHIPPEKIEIIYPGFRDICLLQEEKIDIDVVAPYFLFTGVIKPRKNVLNIVKAFILFKRKYDTPHNLIIVGSGGGEYLKDIKKEIFNAGITDSVIFTGYLSDEQLAYLYKKAYALVYPSIMEGFGFPLLEAMSCGLPIITSNTSSLSEIASNAAITVEPHNLEELVEAYNMLLDSKKYNELVEAGYNRYKRFSWDETAFLFHRLLSEQS